MTIKAAKCGIIIIAVVMMITIAFAGAVSAATAISDKADWLALAGQSGDYYLANSIDFEGESAYVSSFSGTLDGRNFTLSNFSIRLSGTNYVGLIGTYSGTSISNLTISNFSVSGGNYVGGLVGNANSASTFENVIVMNGEVTGSSSVGGLVGCANSASKKIENCAVKNCSVSGSNCVGGLVGAADSASVSVAASWVNGCDISGSNYVGGLVGYAISATKKIDLENSGVENCVVKSNNGYSGGCLGYNGYQADTTRTVDTCTVRNCVIYATGGSNPCGGIIGGCVQSGIPTDYPAVSNCTVAYCTIAGLNSNDVGGIAGSFPAAGILDRNKVISSCVVSKSGKAAGICPTAC